MMTPPVTITLAGRKLDARVLSLRVAGRISQPAQAEVTLSGPARSRPFGTRLEISIADEPLFDGEVTAVELMHGPGSERAWLLRGYDLLHRLRKRQRPRVFEDVTVADLARTFTAELGIEVECEDAGPHVPRLVQHGQSDWDVLAGMASRIGRYLVLEGRTLRIGDLRQDKPVRELHVGDSLWQARFEANTDRLIGGVTAIGWHPQRGEVVTERVGEGDTRTLVDQPPDQLAAAAQAALDLSVARSSYLEGVARGDTSLRPGRTIAVSGLDDTVNGLYTLCGAVHTVNADGYQTRFSTEPPASIAPPTGTSITLGRVTGVSDPDSSGRVRVSLPAYGDLDIGWLSVLCPGAGPGKGIVALPDPGDLVIVALPHENPAEGIVLGALYGPVTPPDHGVEGDAVKRWTLHSSAGQVIVIDDTNRSLKLSNADGSVLELAPELVTLRARTDMLIEAPGHHLNIRAAAVDFEQAVIPVVTS